MWVFLYPLVFKLTLAILFFSYSHNIIVKQSPISLWNLMNTIQIMSICLSIEKKMRHFLVIMRYLYWSGYWLVTTILDLTISGYIWTLDSSNLWYNTIWNKFIFVFRQCVSLYDVIVSSFVKTRLGHIT